MLPYPVRVGYGYSGERQFHRSQRPSLRQNHELYHREKLLPEVQRPIGAECIQHLLGFRPVSNLCGTRTVPPPNFAGSVRSASLVPLSSPVHCFVRAWTATEVPVFLHGAPFDGTSLIPDLQGLFEVCDNAAREFLSPAFPTLAFFLNHVRHQRGLQILTTRC